MTTETKPSGLARKMAAAMGEIGRVQKRGKNEAQGYKYARADDVAEEAREVLAKHGIAVYPDVLDYGVREVDGRNGKLRITWAKVAWTFVDGETGESRTVNAPGEGQDSGDKGIYKAMTGSMKYVLMTSFLIPTGEGDPEHDAEDEKSPPRSRAEAVKARVTAATKPANAKPIPGDSIARKADLFSRMKELGIPGAKMAEQLGEWLGHVVDKNTAFTADDWSRADAAIEQARAAAETIAKAQANVAQAMGS